MIFFSKKKTILSDLIPDNFVDIHSHLIPGIDDGAKTNHDGINLIVELQKIRFEQFITTPHIMRDVWNNSHEKIQQKEKAFNVVLKEKLINTQIKAAAEYMMDMYFLERLQNEKLLTLKDSYILVEMSYLNPPLQLTDIIFAIQVAGYKPILAHPERYLFYHNTFDAYTKLKKAGCLFQLNLLSVTGYYGISVAKIAQKLLSNSMIDFVGSDVHHLNHVQSFENRLLYKEENALKEAIKNNQLFFIETK